MHISKLSLINYRNFRATGLDFNAGVNTIIGENGVGKTNLFRAIRLLLDSNMLASAYRLNEEDFHRSLGDWRGHWIIISMEFDEVSDDESIQALFLHGTGVTDGSTVPRATYNLIFRPRREVRYELSQLSIGDTDGLARIRDSLTISDYETIFTGRSTGNFEDTDFYTSVVGDFDAVKFGDVLHHAEIGVVLPKQLSVAKEISFSFVPALRDVVSDFQGNRPNPLRNLLRSKSGEIDLTAFDTIAEKVIDLNESIEQWPDIESITRDIRRTISETVGDAYSPSSLHIRSDLPSDADQLFQSLKLFVGEDVDGVEGGVHQLSLGGANLIYLTLKLLEFEYSRAAMPIANFLLVEEPEAHIHTHIQKTLFDRLNYDATQIIYSTHSTHISEVSNVLNMNILGRRDGVVEAFQPWKGLDDKFTRNIQRYLDSVRSNLLFARSVILVEGDAEEILIPAMVKKLLGLGLDELGTSLINIRSTGFENVACLFHDQRIRKRCAIVTDLDAVIEVIDPNDTDPKNVTRRLRMERSEESGRQRKNRLDLFSSNNQWVDVFYAPHTFEVDFVDSGNAKTVQNLVAEVWKKKSTCNDARSDLGSGDLARSGRTVLRMANSEGKGWFAVLLASSISPHVAIPEYIIRAIHYANPVLSSEVWFSIFTYRLRILTQGSSSSQASTIALSQTLESFREGRTPLKDLANLMMRSFPSDEINGFLRVFVP